MQHGLVGQTISWGPTIPAVTSDDIHTCFEDGTMSFEFTNAGSAIQNTTIEVQLDTGIFYVPGSFRFSAQGNITILEDNITDLNRPVFSVSTIPSGRQIKMSIDRTADCEAMALRIAGSTSIDSVRIYGAGLEVTYTNGISNGTINYEILYGLLSITNVTTAPELINFGSTSTRSMRITNGAFGTIDEFYIADVHSAGDLDLSNFRINASGSNYSIPPGNVTISGDSVIVAFTPTDMIAIDGSAATVGDGDGLFEADESFILSYDVTPNICGLSNSISSELIGWFGCSYSERCQVAETAATISLTNATPILEFSNATTPSLDFCDTVIYSFTITNNTPETSPPGAAYAKDVTAILGLRMNHTPVVTLANNEMWGTERRNARHFINHELNGIPITLPTTPGLFNTTIPHIPPNFYTSDPDGPGGLTDVDGDGYFDDLPKDASLHISYGVFLEPLDDACGTGRFDYLTWEHISADISWFNDCDLLMSPQRQQFNYTNHIRDYLNSTFTNAPTDLVDGQLFEVGIRPHLHSTIDCNGENGLNGSSMDWITQVVLPLGVSMAPGYDMSIYNVTGNVVTTTAKYSYIFTNFPLQFSCADYDDAGQVIIPISTRYVCNDDSGICYEEEVHCVDLELNSQCLEDCVGVSPLGFTSERISESWTDDTQASLVDLSDPSIVTNYVYPFDTVDLYAQGVMSDTMADELFLRIRYTPENGGNIFDYQDGTIEIVDIDGQYNGGQTNYTFPLTSPPSVNDLGGDNYEMVFDLSSYRSLINANYSYGQSSGGHPNYDADTVKVSAKVVITNTMQVTSPFQVDSLRSEFFLDDGFGDELSCGTWGSELFYEYPTVRASNGTQITTGCFGYQKRFFVTHASETGDNFPNEYRPAIHLDSAIIHFPVGWDVGDVRWIDNVVMDPSDYEFRPDAFSADEITTGGRAQAWLNDYVSLGGTYVTEERDGTDYELKGTDLTLRAGKGTYLRFEYAESDANQATANELSLNGGLTFTSQNSLSNDTDGEAKGVEARINFAELSDQEGFILAWWKDRDAGFSSTARLGDGVETVDTGIEGEWQANDKFRLSGRASKLDQEGQSEFSAISVQGNYEVNEKLNIGTEFRYEDEEDEVSATDGEALLAGAEVRYKLSEQTEVYASGQTVVSQSDDFEDNDLGTIGIEQQVSNRLALRGEVSIGDRGDAVVLGAEYDVTPNLNISVDAGFGSGATPRVGTNYTTANGFELYGSYAVDPDRTDGGNSIFTFGSRKRYGNGLSLYSENQFGDGDEQQSVARTYGLDFDLSDQWRLSASLQTNDIEDSLGDIDRRAATVGTSFNSDALKFGSVLEYREDKNQQTDEDATQWVNTNTIEWQQSESLRWLGRVDISTTQSDANNNDEARFAEIDLGFAYRPAFNDKLNILGNYTFLYDLASSGQDTSFADQRSHVFALEGIYDVNQKWEVGAKLAYRTGDVRVLRGEGPWIETGAHLAVTRARYHLLKKWDALVEYRWLETEGEDDSRQGALAGLYRHVGDNLKVGAGYNFTDFSDDLTDNDYDANGWFFDITGKY